MSDPVIWPLSEEGVFTVVYKLGPIPFKEICEDALRISSVGEGPAPLLNGIRTSTQPKWRKVDAWLKKLRRQSLIEFKRKPSGWVAAEQIRDSSVVVDLLCMTSEVINIPVESTIDSWAPWDRAQVALWAWAKMYSASDNAYVRIPAVPAILKPFMELN